MKSLLFAILPFFASAQLRTGTWNDNGAIIERPNDSTQIEHHNGRIDTLTVLWLTSYSYRLVGDVGAVTVHVTHVFKHGYSGVAVCNGRKKKFEFIRVDQN